MFREERKEKKAKKHEFKIIFTNSREHEIKVKACSGRIS